jgi:hypothetical protein
MRPRGQGPRLGRADVAPEAEVFTKRVGDVELTVVDQTAETARRIFATAAIIEGTDVHGCEPDVRVVPRFGRYLAFRSTDLDAVNVAEFVSVCRYQIGVWDQPTLYASKQLSPTGTAEALTLMRSAASLERPKFSPEDGCAELDAVLLRVWVEGAPINVWVHHAACAGIDDGVRLRVLPNRLRTLVVS